MNVRDTVKPTFGVSIVDGQERQIGLDYSKKISNSSMRMTKREYTDKYESLDVYHRLQKQSTNIKMEKQRALMNKSEIING